MLQLPRLRPRALTVPLRLLLKQLCIILYEEGLHSQTWTFALTLSCFWTIAWRNVAISRMEVDLVLGYLRTSSTSHDFLFLEGICSIVGGIVLAST
jgi:hypothetical protein